MEVCFLQKELCSSERGFVGPRERRRGEKVVSAGLVFSPQADQYCPVKSEPWSVLDQQYIRSRRNGQPVYIVHTPVEFRHISTMIISAWNSKRARGNNHAIFLRLQLTHAAPRGREAGLATVRLDEVSEGMKQLMLQCRRAHFLYAPTHVIPNFHFW